MNLQKITKVRNKAAWDVCAALRNPLPPPREILYDAPSPIPGKAAEFVHRLSVPAYIEPSFGYVITTSGRLVMEPLSTTEKFGKWPWRYGLPSPAEHFRALRDSSHPILRFPQVVSLRFLWEWNYFHFYADVLGTLALLEQVGIDPAIPVVLGSYARDVPFVQEILCQGKFRERNWILPDKHTYVLADSIIYGSPQRYDLRHRYDYIVSQMQPPGPFPTAEERIFLTRKASHTRSILNIGEVEEVLHRHGFRSVDTSELSIQQQMDLFARTRFLIGIHGAGLTNIIFRQGCPLDLIELHSDVYTVGCFHSIADTYGYGWDHLAGQSEVGKPQHANFRVPLEELEEKVKAMLGAGRTTSSSPTVARDEHFV